MGREGSILRSQLVGHTLRDPLECAGHPIVHTRGEVVECVKSRRFVDNEIEHVAHIRWPTESCRDERERPLAHPQHLGIEFAALLLDTLVACTMGRCRMTY